MSDRGRRLEHQQRAYELQLAGGLKGMAWWTVYGVIGVGLAHHFSPGFRKQTWAIKAFLVTSSSIFGLCLGADDMLLKYESAQREAENVIRREARNALASRGIIATEGQIRLWRAEQAAERARAAEADAHAQAAAAAGEEGDEGVIAHLEKAAERAGTAATTAFKTVEDTGTAEESKILEAVRTGRTRLVKLPHKADPLGVDTAVQIDGKGE